ncbi:MAG: hypothetical protein ACR2MN_13670 [Acidimicrobiales bacterium]
MAAGHDVVDLLGAGVTTQVADAVVGGEGRGATSSPVAGHTFRGPGHVVASLVAGGALVVVGRRSDAWTTIARSAPW